jgi:hypothetical protein
VVNDKIPKLELSEAGHGGGHLERQDGAQVRAAGRGARGSHGVVDGEPCEVVGQAGPVACVAGQGGFEQEDPQRGDPLSGRRGHDIPLHWGT